MTDRRPGSPGAHAWSLAVGMRSCLEDRRASDVLPKIDSLVFDLDGTLWDTCEACAAGWNNVRRRHGIAFRTITVDDVRSVAGKPHDSCIREIFVGVPEEQLRILSDETQAEDNRLIAQRGGTLFAGVKEGLQALASRYPLFIVSNCQAGYIEIFLAFTGLSRLFRDTECFGNTGRSKADNLRAIIARNALSSPLFIGDTPGDQAAASANEVPFAFASYGYGRCEKMHVKVDSFRELRDMLMG
jgi:phosphoglycolate phosphatase